MLTDPTYTGLTVDVYRRDDQGAYLFAVNIEGVPVVIGARKLGGIDSDIETARIAASQSQPVAAPPTTATQ